MAGLTEKNRRAIDLYLSVDEEYQGNGTACWQKVYGTKSEETAATNWWRMLRNAEAQGYLEQRQQEIRDAVKDRISYEIEDALRDLLRIRKTAEDNGDLTNAVKATVEAVKVQGKYIQRTESTTIDLTPEDRMAAAHYGLSPSDYVQRREAGTLPDVPPVPDLH